MNKLIYLDNAATTFPKPERVYQALDKANREMAVNAGRGSYKLARQATALIEETKNKLCQLIHLEEAETVFAPSITIAMNQIINGLEWKDGSVIYVSPYEHNAVARTLNYLAKEKKVTIKELPINVNTFEIDVEKVKYEFSRFAPTAVFCTHVSNVTGYILPVKEIFQESRRFGGINVLDTAQSMGLVPIDCREIEVDFIAFAGHKTLYGPLGIGGFINITKRSLKEFVVGGTGSDSLNLDMPPIGSGKFEAASSNVPAIAGLNAALDTINMEDGLDKEKQLLEYLVSGLEELPGITLYVPKDKECRVGIVSFAIEGMESEDVAMILDEDFNIAVRAGYHCAPYIHKYLKDGGTLGTIRVGIGRFTTKEELDQLISAVKEIIE